MYLSERVFLGRSLDALSMTIERQTEALFRLHDIIVPVRSCSLMVALDELGAASAADLAAKLETTHQLVSQKLPKLQRLGLISAYKDRSDARRRVFELTESGREQLSRIASQDEQIDAVYADLFGTHGDLFTIIGNVHTALKDKALTERIDQLEQAVGET